LRCGLTPLFPETLPAAFSALIFAQRARVAAAIRFLPAADIWRVGRAVVSTLPSPNSDRTCCSLEISARTSLTIFSTLNVFPIVADATGQDSTALASHSAVQFSDAGTTSTRT